MTGLRRRRGGASADAGSVFVESVIAAAIVAMVLAATLRTIADSAARERAIEARSTAMQIAQSEIAAVGSEIPLAAGETSGVVGAQVWRVRISPYEEAGGDSAAGPLWRVAVSVQARGGGGDLARLETLRLGGRAS